MLSIFINVGTTISTWNSNLYCRKKPLSICLNRYMTKIPLSNNPRCQLLFFHSTPIIHPRQLSLSQRPNKASDIIHGRKMHPSPARFLAVCLAFFVGVAPAIGDGSLTAYEILQQYDFPIGILPTGVESYELNRNTGKFAVYFGGSCSFTIEGYNLKYNKKITGTISNDRLSNLSGVQVKILLFWLNIVEVTHKGDNLEFSVGIASAGFGIDNFYECPQCGCGFSCVNGNSSNLHTLVSSS